MRNRDRCLMSGISEFKSCCLYQLLWAYYATSLSLFSLKQDNKRAVKNVLGENECEMLSKGLSL